MAACQPACQPAQVIEPDVVDLTEDDLVNEILLLIGHINAATYRLICLIQELDRRQPWGAWDCTPAEWLNIYCGISPGCSTREGAHGTGLEDVAVDHRGVSQRRDQLLQGTGADASGHTRA